MSTNESIKTFPIDLSIPVAKKGEGAMPTLQKRQEEVEAASEAGSSSSPTSSTPTSPPPPPTKPDGPQWAMDAMGFFLTKGENCQYQRHQHRIVSPAAVIQLLQQQDATPEQKCSALTDAIAERLDWWRFRARELDSTTTNTTSSTSASASATSTSTPPPATAAASTLSNAVAFTSPGGSPTQPSLQHHQGQAQQSTSDNVDTLASWKRLLLHEIRSRIRHQGVSPAERAIAWPLLGGLEYERTARLERCMEILSQRTIDQELRDVMLRDLGRTLPTHSLFRGSTSIGQTRLERVLCCYCALDPEVGYCQGMGFIVAVLLLHMREADAFGLFVQMMYGRRYAMRGLFQTGFPLLQRMLEVFRALLRMTLPRLMDHFDNIGIDPGFFANHWFMTLFAYQFSVPVVCRVWDLFFAEGWVWIFRVAIALLVADEAALLEMPMEEILMKVKLIHEGKSENEIIEMAKNIVIRESDLVVTEGGNPTTGRFP